MKVAELYALFSFKPDLSSIRQTNKAIRSVRYGLMSVAGFMGGRFLAKSMLGFNSTVEDSKNQIAGMLALARKTDMADQVGNASALYEGLRKQAAELPGTTQDYVNMLGMLVQPLANAGTSMEDMQMITTNTMIASRGLGENWQKAARDVSEFVNFGKFNQVDTFIRRMLEPMGFKATDAMKKKLKAMSQQERRDIWKRAMEQKQIAQLRDAQANSYSGKMDKLKDATQQFLGKVGEPLFKALKETVEELANWLGKNEEKVKGLASSIGGVLTDAFNIIKGIVQFFLTDGDRLTALLVGLGFFAVAFGVKMAAAWIAAAGPVVGVIALVSGLVLLFLKLKEGLGPVGAAIATALAAVAVIKLIKYVRDLVPAFRAAAGAAGLLSAAQAGGGAAAGAMRAAGSWRKSGPIGSATFANAALAVGGLNNAPIGRGAQAVGSIGMGGQMVNPAGAGKMARAGGAFLKNLPLVGSILTGVELLSDLTGGPMDNFINRAMGPEAYQMLHGAEATPPAASVENQTTITINAANMDAATLAQRIQFEIDQAQANGNRVALQNLGRNGR